MLFMFFFTIIIITILWFTLAASIIMTIESKKSTIFYVNAILTWIYSIDTKLHMHHIPLYSTVYIFIAELLTKTVIYQPRSPVTVPSGMLTIMWARFAEHKSVSVHGIRWWTVGTPVSLVTKLYKTISQEIAVMILMFSIRTVSFHVNTMIFCSLANKCKKYIY